MELIPWPLHAHQPCLSQRRVGYKTTPVAIICSGALVYGLTHCSWRVLVLFPGEKCPDIEGIILFCAHGYARMNCHILKYFSTLCPGTFCWDECK